jgi:hypothetical protein
MTDAACTACTACTACLHVLHVLLVLLVLQKLTGRVTGDLPGGYTLPDGSRLAVYGPGQWFTPCNWDDWDCAVSVPERA